MSEDHECIIRRREVGNWAAPSRGFPEKEESSSAGPQLSCKEETEGASGVLSFDPVRSWVLCHPQLVLAGAGSRCEELEAVWEIEFTGCYCSQN